jgi:hypothetical protein
MQELNKRLLILFAAAGALALLGRFENPEVQEFVLTDTNLILKQDARLEQPSIDYAQEILGSDNELTPSTEEIAQEQEQDGNAVAGESSRAPASVALQIQKLGVKRKPKVMIADFVETPAEINLPSTASELVSYSTLNQVAATPPVAEQKPAEISSEAAEILASLPASALTPAATEAAATSSHSTARLAATAPVPAAPVKTASVARGPASISKAQPAECEIVIESPNGGESLSESIGERIAWSSRHAGEQVRINLMKGDEDLGTLVRVSNDGSTLVRIPALIEPGADYRVKIESLDDPNCFGQSAAVFNIVP